VWAVTDDPGAAVCPDCGTVSGRVHEYLLTRPRDLRRGPGGGVRGLAEAALEVHEPGVLAQDVHRVAAALDAGTGTALPP
jgi:hypothetical protein